MTEPITKFIIEAVDEVVLVKDADTLRLIIEGNAQLIVQTVDTVLELYGMLVGLKVVGARDQDDNSIPLDDLGGFVPQSKPDLYLLSTGDPGDETE